MNKVCWKCEHEFTRFRWHMSWKVGEICAHCPRCNTNLAIKPEEELNGNPHQTTL